MLVVCRCGLLASVQSLRVIVGLMVVRLNGCGVLFSLIWCLVSAALSEFLLLSLALVLWGGDRLLLTENRCGTAM